MPYIAPIISEQYPATDQTQCITIYIPAGDEFKALAAGLLAIAANALNYDDPDSAQADGLAAVWDDAYSQIDWEGCVLPSQIGAQDNVLLMQQFAAILSGNAFAFVVTNQMGGYALQNPAANNDSWVHNGIRLRTGLWRLRCFYARQAAGGRINLTLNNADGGADITLTSIDTYNAATLYNQRLDQDFTVTEEATYELIGTMSDGSGPGSTYAAWVTAFNLFRISD